MIWEYKTAINDVVITNSNGNTSNGFNVSETDNFLNIMGLANWELVTVNPIVSEGNTIQLVYFFKKPLNIGSSSLPEIGYDIDHNGISGSQQ
jgi:hypothetical protein